MIRSSLIGGALAVLCLFGLAPVAGAAGDTCPRGFRCGTVTVPLDRSGAQPGTIALRVARHVASARTGKPALIVLTGGPGQPAVPFAPQIEKSVRSALRRYQLVVFDQRGTGGSGALRCPALQAVGESPPSDEAIAATAGCGAALGVGAGDYQTAASVEDIDAVRAAVGADKVALIGTSYGTHVIQRYLLAHPDRVDRVVLDSVVRPGGVDAFQRDSYAATRRVLSHLQRGADTATAKLVARLARGKLTGRLYDAHGRARTAAIRDSAALFNVLLAGDTSALLRSQFPAAVRAANAGDPAPLLRLRALANGPEPPVTDLSAGLYAATTCTDVAMPWPESSAPGPRRATFDASVARLDPAGLGVFDVRAARDTSIAGACLGWPAVDRTPDSTPTAYAKVPALILNGDADLRTPTESARQVADLIPGARLVAVAGTGHDVIGSDESGCVARVLSRFLAGKALGRSCEGVSNGLDHAAGPFPHRLSQLPPRGGTGRAARALAAALATAGDAERVVLARLMQGAPPRFGGLRGGSVSGRVVGDDVRLRLDRYAFLPGLRVTGTVTVGRRSVGTLRLAGLAEGTVRMRKGGLTATIDGRRLHLAARSPARRAG